MLLKGTPTWSKCEKRLAGTPNLLQQLQKIVNHNPTWFVKKVCWLKEHQHRVI
jgi:hypothetical protein